MSALQPAKRRRSKEQVSNVAVLLGTFLLVVVIGSLVVWVVMGIGTKTPEQETALVDQNTAEEEETAQDTTSIDTAIQTPTEAEPSDSDSTNEVADSETQDEEEGTEESTEPLEIVRPELDEIKGFVPTGGTFVRYWWNNMNADAYEEVLVGYTKDGESHVLNLGVKDETKGYEVTWDQVVPAGQLVDLTSGRAGDGYVVKVQTAETGGGNVALYAFGDEAVTTYPIVGGRLDGLTTEVAYASEEGNSPDVPAAVKYVDRTLVVDFFTESELEGDPEQVIYEREKYALEDGKFVFLSTETYSPEAVEAAE